MVAVAQNLSNEPKFGRKRSFRLHDLDEITALLVNRHSEQAACLHLGINPKSWYNWKHRNKNSEKGREALERMRVKEFEARARNISDAAQGKGPHKRADWRADLALLQMKFPQYFPDSNASQAVQQPTVTLDVMAAIIAKLTAGQAMKQVTEKATVDVQTNTASEQNLLANNDVSSNKSQASQ